MPIASDILKEKGFTFLPISRLKESLSTMDLVVIDQQGPIQCRSLFEDIKLSAPRAVILAMDYFYRDHTELDVMVNLVDYHLTEWRDGQIHCDYYEGLEYAVIRPPFVSLRPREVQARAFIEKVLITFGGEDPSCWSHKIPLWLEQHVREKVLVKIALGPLNGSLKEIRNILQSNQNRHTYELLNYIPDIEQHMSEADLIFCGGGTTIMEAAFLGKPAVALPQHETERLFLTYFEKAGYLLPDLEESITNLMDLPISNFFVDSELRHRLSERGLKLIDGNGAARIAGIISEKLLTKN